MENLESLSPEEMELLYQITKIIAEADSIGEGYGYCEEYDKYKFEKEKQILLTANENTHPSVIHGCYLKYGLQIFNLKK